MPKSASRRNVNVRSNSKMGAAAEALGGGQQQPLEVGDRPTRPTPSKEKTEGTPRDIIVTTPEDGEEVLKHTRGGGVVDTYVLPKKKPKSVI
jgi:hypothetical protein